MSSSEAVLQSNEFSCFYLLSAITSDFEYLQEEDLIVSIEYSDVIFMSV